MASATGTLEQVETDREREARADAAHDRAVRAVSLTPGRVAASVKFTGKELEALEVLLLDDGPHTAKSEASRNARLEKLGISAEWFQILHKVSEANYQLARVS